MVSREAASLIPGDQREPPVQVFIARQPMVGLNLWTRGRRAPLIPLLQLPGSPEPPLVFFGIDNHSPWIHK